MTGMKTMPRTNERGIAMIVVLFMVLAMSVIGASVMYMTQTETQSSQNYRLMSQARYGAESGVHVAANYLLSSGYAAVMPATAGDAWTNYDVTKSPVTYSGNPVILSSTSSSSTLRPPLGDQRACSRMSRTTDSGTGSGRKSRVLIRVCRASVTDMLMLAR